MKKIITKFICGGLILSVFTLAGIKLMSFSDGPYPYGNIGMVQITENA